MAQAMQPVVDIQSFSMQFGEKRVINDLSFSVNQGEVFGFLGANGAGKTTTIRALLALMEPTGGTLLIEGKPYDPTRSALVGYLPEERGLYRNEPILETMTYFGILHGLHKSEAKKRAEDYLDRVGLADKAYERLVRLSGGQQQKVQLGVTILHDPTLMILDEPTEALDPVNRSLLMNIIAERRAKGATVMLVTHRMEEVEQLCDRILFLKDGGSALYGAVDDVKRQFGGQVIVIEYSGKLSDNPSAYEIRDRQPHYAELVWGKTGSPNDVFHALAKQRDLRISRFEVRQPSLNDIFLELYKQPAGANHG